MTKRINLPLDEISVGNYHAASSLLGYYRYGRPSIETIQWQVGLAGFRLNTVQMLRDKDTAHMNVRR